MDDRLKHHVLLVFNLVYVRFVIAALLVLAALNAEGAQLPGPSQSLFNNHYYTCQKNYYVATDGSDSNSGSSSRSAWLTLQHANNSLPAGGAAAGTCINVAPGTYSHGVLITAGGNLASKTGYVVYRCTTMDACTVTDVSAGGQNGSFVWSFATKPMTGNYIFIDGFKMSAASETLYGQGIEVEDGNEVGKAATTSVHHIWVLNSIINGYGQSGIQMNDGEFFYVLHNTIYSNSRVGCAAQGSGVSFAILKAFSSYVRTPDDGYNSMLGNIGSFNNAIEFNVLFNNAITKCGSPSNPYDTDGNGIIADTFNNAGSTDVVYPGSLLIAFNVVYNSGARGIHIFNSENITVANNSCYDNDLDPSNSGTYRPCIGDLYGYNDYFLNNISYAVAGSGYLAYNDAFVGGLTPGSSKKDTFTNNVAYCIGDPLYGCTPMYNGDAFSCTTNQCNANPDFRSVGNQSPGSETTQPVQANFALQPGSPAIGKGLKVSYLPAQSVDIGACPSTVTVCPVTSSQP